MTWTDDAVIQHRTVDVGVAVATERGLMTPVIRDVALLISRSTRAKSPTIHGSTLGLTRTCAASRMAQSML